MRGPARISLSVDAEYRVVQSTDDVENWEVQTAGYIYSLKDGDHRDIIAYHWHPARHSHVVVPHLHLYAGAMVGRPELTRAHLPTGLINLADLLRLAVADFQVRPRRSDWAVVRAPAAPQASSDSS